MSYSDIGKFIRELYSVANCMNVDGVVDHFYHHGKMKMENINSTVALIKVW